MWSGCLGDIEWGMCGVRDPLGNALKMVKKHIKSAEKSNNQNGWCGIKQSKSHKYHFPIPLVFRIKTIKIPGKSREMDNTGVKAQDKDKMVGFHEATQFRDAWAPYTQTQRHILSYLIGVRPPVPAFSPPGSRTQSEHRNPQHQRHPWADPAWGTRESRIQPEAVQHSVLGHQ